MVRSSRVVRPTANADRASVGKAPPAAIWSLVLGLVAMASLWLIVIWPNVGLVSLVLSGLGGLFLARSARGSRQRFSKTRWPGRRMAIAGAVLSWVAFVVPATLLLVIAYVLSHWNGF